MHVWLLAAAAFLVLAVVVARPRIVLSPIIAVFALVGWVKLVGTIPLLVREWIAAATLEKNAATLQHHAEVASRLYATNAEYRNAAREIYNRVTMGYGIGNALGHPLDDSSPAVASAAALVANSKGKS